MLCRGPLLALLLLVSDPLLAATAAEAEVAGASRAAAAAASAEEVAGEACPRGGGLSLLQKGANFAQATLARATGVAALASQDAAALAEDLNTLKRRRSSEQVVGSASPWELLAALSDSPPGAYFGLVDPVLKAVDLAYCASAGPEYKPKCANETIPPAYGGGGSWERLYGLENCQMTTGGPHVLVFADHASKRAIFAIRASCLDGNKYEQCNMDACFMDITAAFGSVSALVYGGQANLTRCPEYEGKLNYVEQTEALVEKAQDALPDYDLLLTGHSMGGFLASVVGALHPALKVITFAPSPFHTYLKVKLGWSDEQVAQVNRQNLVATCDPFDCGINSDFVEKARLGGTTCIFFGTQEPPPCWPYGHAVPYQSDNWRSQLKELPALLCKGEAHNFTRYVGMVHERSAKNSGAPAHMPTCSEDFSVISYAQRDTAER